MKTLQTRLKLRDYRKSLPGKRKRVAVWTGVAILGLCVAATAYFVFGRPPPDQPQIPEEKAVAVSGVTLQERPLRRTIEVIGRVEPNAVIRIAVEQPGLVSEIAVDKGQRVRTGDLLLRQDLRVAETALEESRLQLVEAERDLARQTELLKSGAISVRDFQGVETRAQMARVSRNRMEILLSKREIRSPSDGLIEERFLEPGDFGREGDPAFRMIDLSVVKIAFDVPEREVARVATGRVYRVRADALPGREFEGEMTFLSAHAAYENSSFAAELRLPNREEQLRPGMLARVTLDLGVLENAVAVPVHAIVPQRGEHVVFVARDGRAERRIVRIAEFGVDEAVVTSGVSPGEVLIVEGHRRLSDGQSIRVETAQGAGEPETGGQP